MHHSWQNTHAWDLGTVVKGCLPRLKTISAVLDKYGQRDRAAELRDIARQFHRALPRVSQPGDPAEFVVADTLIVRRRDVAELLSRAFERGSDGTYRIVEFTEPQAWNFRAYGSRILRLLNHALNEGGSLGIARNEPGSEVFRLDIHSIAAGLNFMARQHPAHFADFINAKAHSTTATIFLDCCRTSSAGPLTGRMR